MCVCVCVCVSLSLCSFCCQEVTEESAEEGLIVAASGAEAATGGASEGPEEATGEDTALAKWMQGQSHSQRSLMSTFEGFMT